MTKTCKEQMSLNRLLCYLSILSKHFPWFLWNEVDDHSWLESLQRILYYGWAISGLDVSSEKGKQKENEGRKEEDNACSEK